MSSNLCTLQEFIDEAKKQAEQSGHDEIFSLFTNFIGMLTTDLKSQVLDAHKKKKHSVTFVNFWSIQWDEHLIEVTAEIENISSAKKLTQKFNLSKKDGREAADFLHYIVTKPPGFLPLLERMSKQVAKNSPRSLKNGSNLGYLFWLFFRTVFEITYNQSSPLLLKGLGRFERETLNSAADKTKAVLKFTPEIIV